MIADNGGMGGQHVWAIAYNDQEAYEVDISPNVYETGGGYNWKKIPGVVFNQSHIFISKVDRDIIDQLD